MVNPASLQRAYAGKRVLITGGLGFIGSTLAIALIRLGAEVTVIDSLIPEYGGNLQNLAGYADLIRVNISDVRDTYGISWLVQDQDILFNLAGQTSHLDSMTDPLIDLDINSRSQLTILEACRHHNPGIRIVFASTRQIYGKPNYLPVDEDHPIVPVDVNGINKLSGEMYHLLYAQVYGMRICALRLTNTYGPRMRVKDSRQTFLGIWIRQLLDNQPIIIYGDGSQLRDFNYVDDVVDAFLLAAVTEDSWGQAFNLGDDQPISLVELSNLLIKLNGGGCAHKVDFPPERKAIDIGNYYANFTRFQSLTGWQPCTELEQGLARTLDYYRQHRHHYWDAVAQPMPYADPHPAK